ncbi:MAG: glutathione S-transferase N-terminal domain-containing protein [Planctomycetota bacterium]
MITLYRTPGCPRCSDIQSALAELAITHEVVELDSADDLPAGVEADALPVLVDDGTTAQGPTAIMERLGELEGFRDEWYKFQSDACYCDEAGNVE